MKRANLPLTALRSFEVAARHQSFTKAAAELFVSQAAISRQVRELEKRLAVSLFDRFAQNVRLTAAGNDLLHELTPAFDRMELALSSTKKNRRQACLTLTVEAGFAGCWLLPRLNKFYAEHPGVEVDLDTQDQFSDFRPHEPQLAIRYSETQTGWENAEARYLLNGTMIPVWSPGLVGDNWHPASPSDILRQPLLHEFGARCWQHWSEQMGEAYAGPDRGQRYDNQMMLLQAALNGQGIALIDQIFVTQYLETGELNSAYGNVDWPGAYWLVTPKFCNLSPAGQSFVRWLEKELRGSLI